MRYEFDYDYSDEHLRLAMKRSLAEQVSWSVLVALGAVLVLSLALCAADGWEYLCGLIHGGVILLVLLFFLVRQTAAENAQHFARKLPTRAAHCRFTEEAMTVENALATSELKWPVVQKVVRGPDVWLFFLARGQFWALPADKIDAELGAFIEGRVTAAGGKMR